MGFDGMNWCYGMWFSCIWFGIHEFELVHVGFEMYVGCNCCLQNKMLLLFLNYNVTAICKLKCCCYFSIKMQLFFSNKIVIVVFQLKCYCLQNEMLCCLPNKMLLFFFGGFMMMRQGWYEMMVLLYDERIWYVNDVWSTLCDELWYKCLYVFVVVYVFSCIRKARLFFHPEGLVSQV